MDKLMDNHWFLKGISLLLALMLYLSIHLGKQPETLTSNGFLIGDATETIANVEVASYYDQEKYVVTGLPKHVDMILEGRGSLIVSTKLKQQYEVYANLNDYEPGTYEVRLQYTGIPDELKAKLTPAKARITIEEKVKKAFPVEVSFLNASYIKEGYVADKASVKPGYIDIYGTEEQLKQIGAVRAYVDLKSIDETFTRETKVTIYDKSGNRLELQTKPDIVTVTVPVTSPEKTVPLKVTKKGTPPEGITIKSIQVEPGEAAIYGPKDILAGISAIEDLTVDVGSITDSTTVEVTVPIPKGVIKVIPGKVKVSIQVEKKISRAFSDVPIAVNGLKEDQTVTFLDPPAGKINVTAAGEQQVLNKLQLAQIQASINVKDLEIGTHEVPVQVSGPENIAFDVQVKTVKIEITSKA